MAVRKRGKYLYVDFYCYLPGGQKTRCLESTRLTDTKPNRKRVEALEKAIAYELKHGRFEYLRYFPHGSKAKHFRDSMGAMTFGEFWATFLQEKALSPTTRSNWGSRYKRHIEPVFGHSYISQITEHDVLVFRKDLQDKGLKPSTVNQVVSRVCECLLKAHKRKLIPEYICADLAKLSEPIPDVSPLSFDELRHLLDYLEPKKPGWYDLVLFWSRTGLRPGEIMALKWEYVDWFNEKVLVRATKCQVTHKDKPPKTGPRDVDLRPEVIYALKRQEARTKLMDGHVWLNGSRRWNQKELGQAWRHILRLAKLKHRPIRELRHTFATLHIAAGESITWVSKMLGHSSVEMTLRKYNRYVRNLTRDDGSAYEKIMSGGEIGNNLGITKRNHLK
jgi:integrase